MTIVAAVDRSGRAEAVIGEAARLAEEAGSEVHLVHVGDVDVPHTATGFDPEREVAVARSRATGVARELADQQDVREAVEPVGLSGNPVEQILAYSREHDAEYIVVSARRRSPVSQAVFGSVTQALMLKADCPVAVVPHETE
jgi:nucleotide-binding universal stress UspA family protein